MPDDTKMKRIAGGASGKTLERGVSKNIISLDDYRDDQEEFFWVCNCGCRTFYLFNNEEARCAQCETTVVSEEGGWKFPPPAPAEETGDDETIFRSLPTELVIARLVKSVTEDDVSMVIVIRRCGRTTSTGFDEFDTPESRSWLFRRLRDSYRAAVRN